MNQQYKKTSHQLANSLQSTNDYHNQLLSLQQQVARLTQLVEQQQRAIRKLNSQISASDQ